MDIFGFGPCAFDQDRFAGLFTEKTFRDLASCRISRTENKNSGFHFKSIGVPESAAPSGRQWRDTKSGIRRCLIFHEEPSRAKSVQIQIERRTSRPSLLINRPNRIRDAWPDPGSPCRGQSPAPLFDEAQQQRASEAGR